MLALLQITGDRGDEMISVMPARSARDFDAAADLCRRLGQWDAEAVAPHGVSAADVTAIFHPDRSGSDLAMKYGHPDAMMFLARVEGVPAGCAYAIAALTRNADVRS
jgi:hypothetical protein